MNYNKYLVIIKAGPDKDEIFFLTTTHTDI